MFLFSRWCLFGLALFLSVLASPAPRAQQPAPAVTLEQSAVEPPLPTENDHLPFKQAIHDPWEPMNRAFFGFNDGLVRYVNRPLLVGYKFIFPAPARKSIRKFAYNLAFPVRLFSTMFQGKWMGSLHETDRFLVNTTIGLLGFFDPATKFGIPTFDEDFGQTFGYHGSGTGPFLTIPLMGPSSGRDGLGKIPDTIFNLGTYIPGSGFIFGLNDFSFAMPGYLHLTKVNHDPYVLIRDAWAIKRQADVEDFQIPPSKSDPAPTLGAILLQAKNPKFVGEADERRVRIESTGRKLPYSLWLQKSPAPILYILPGTGSHRRDTTAVAFAELAFERGFSVVSISSAFSWEFMENAATVSVPGYPATDSTDVYDALSAIHTALVRKYGARIMDPSLIGFSLGGLHTLLISEHVRQHSAAPLRFSRYVSVNSPISLLYAAAQLDAYYNTPLQWTAGRRGRMIDETLMKAAKLFESGLKPGDELPFDRAESHFLIGLTFRLILRDVIYTSQVREDLGVLKAEHDNNEREAVYNEISTFSFIEYFKEFLMPYYESRRNVGRTEMLRNEGLLAIESGLALNPAIRVFTNEDDFLLRPEDLDWMRNTLDTRAVIFPVGGHLGNLHLPEVQTSIMNAFDGLTLPPTKN